MKITRLLANPSTSAIKIRSCNYSQPTQTILSTMPSVKRNLPKKTFSQTHCKMTILSVKAIRDLAHGRLAVEAEMGTTSWGLSRVYCEDPFLHSVLQPIKFSKLALKPETC